MMKKRTNIPILAFLLILVALSFAIQKYYVPKNRSTSSSFSAGGGIPPGLSAAAIALGPLRGFIANALWWRIVEQQDQGNYFEIMQLADWVTSLQPENPRVWTFQAWNMAYNLSYEFPDGESKWKWVYNAIELLSLRAIKYNPDNMEIKKEIASIFFDRVGSSIDPGKDTYVRKWATLMVKFMPEGTRDELKILAAAPEKPDELLKNPEISAMAEKLQKTGIDILDEKTFYSYQTWTPEQQKLVGTDNQARKLMGMIDSTFKARELREKFGLDPKKMLFIDEQFGPFDWRLFQAYTVYWAAPGSFKDYCEQGDAQEKMIRTAMTSSFLEGRLLLDIKGGVFITTTNFRIIEKIHDYYDYMMLYHYSQQIDYLHKVFLEQAAAILYTNNQKEAAEEVFGHYKEGYADDKIDFETFISTSLYKTLHNETGKSRRALIESSLFQAFNWLATGDVQRSIGYANFAKLVWERHQRLHSDNPSTKLPPFENFVKSAYSKVMDSQIAPEFKKRLSENMELKEFDGTLEKAGTGELMKKQDTYEKREGEYRAGKITPEDFHYRSEEQ